MKLHELVAATFAAVGQEVSDLTLTVICKDLQGYDPKAVAVALGRCRKELRKIALGDILDRIPGSLPGPEEAWAIVAPSLNDEGVTVVWTQEIATAFGVALGLRDDPVAARMAFKETYAKLKFEARERGDAVRWMPSLGHDANGREGPILDAVGKGRLSLPNVRHLLPNPEPADPRVAALLAPVEEQKRLK